MTDHVLSPQCLDATLFPQTGHIPTGERRWLGALSGALPAWVLSVIHQQHAQLMVMVAKDPAQVSVLEQELQFFGVNAQVFPDWETLPYDRLSVHQDIVSERLSLLANMPKTGVILVAASTLLQRVAPPAWLLGQFFDFQVGQRFVAEDERTRLSRAGYRAVETVYEPGEYAIRGSLMDIYPTGQDAPIRIELFDDEIESLRQFDSETQRTLPQGQIQSFRILPAREFPLIEGRGTFRARFAELFPDTSPKKFALYQDVLSGVASAGLEYYQPLFFEHDEFVSTGTLFDYLPAQTLLVTDQHVESCFEAFWQELNRRYDDRRHDVNQPVLPPNELFLTVNECLGRMKAFGRLVLDEQPVRIKAGAYNLDAQAVPMLAVDQRSAEPMRLLAQFVQSFAGRVLLVAHSAGRRESLLNLLRPVFGEVALVDDYADFLAQSAKLALATAPLERGFVLPDQLALITENQLFAQHVSQTRRRKNSEVSQEFLIKSLAELSIGAPVVHIDHGVGRYAGLTNLEIDGQLYEFLQIDYADQAKVYVPVANLHLISRYSGGDPDHAPLHKIGSDTWNKAKRRAMEQIHDVAAELLNVQARRMAKAGMAFELDEHAYDLFASQFAFEETQDQQLAIAATLHDMTQPKPMDRLVCGDVGFGKTEVAMRAAFVAVHAGMQVAVLVPTTLLAQQHLDNFRDRFADWPVRIEALSRFGGKKAQDQTIADIGQGKVDIVIGTHKLLQEDVKFKQLGLMIVDEEHRFGVRDKEKIKAMRADVDMLTLTATPIPRTLNMAFSGMRDLSIISTPPAKRLAVKTFVHEYGRATIKEAVLRELLRGGQVYFLHNEVDTIERTAEELRAWIPEARVAVAHGQMRERELEQVMQSFYHKQANVLVCSTIIETGIDVPNANTIIIERADKLGLAQLHQLRGRVGRSHHQAYAYLLVPSIKALKGDAEKRLDAITRASTLGAGFVLATEDLEIRGAGELLGEEQSGNMQAIGFSLYMEMLERATKAIQNGKAPNLDAPLSLTAEINVHTPALIPDEYLGDVHQRLLFYKRISGVHHQADLNDIRMEMIDRFGLLPTATKTLFDVHRLRLKAERLGVAKVDMSAQGGFIEFLPDTPVEGIRIIQMIQAQPQLYRLEGGQRLKIMTKLAEVDGRMHFIEQLFAQLLPEQATDAPQLTHHAAKVSKTSSKRKR